MASDASSSRLTQISQMKLQEIMINPSRLAGETGGSLGAEVADPGFSSVLDLLSAERSESDKLDPKAMEGIAQALCSLLETVHSTDGLFLGFLSVNTFYLSRDRTQFRIILNEEAVSDSDNDLDRLGNVLLGLSALAFLEGPIDTEIVTRDVIIVPSTIPYFWQDTINRCVNILVVRPSFAWIRDYIAQWSAWEPPESVPKGIDPWLYEKALNICALQSLLMDISEDTIAYTLDDLLESPYVTDDQLAEAFVHYLIIAVFHRPAKVQLLVRITNELFARLEPQKVELLKRTILKMFPEKPASSGSWSNASAQMYFLYLGVQTGMFTGEEIVGMIRDLCADRSGPGCPLRRVAVHLFAYFAETIAQVDLDLFNFIMGELPYFRCNQGPFRAFFRQIKDLMKDDWKLLKQARAGEGDIRTVLANDRVEELRELAAHPSFDVNGRIPQSLFEPVFMESSSPTLLHYAAFYGAVECFNYLLVCGADPSLEDDLEESVLAHAVGGGSIEIVRACEQHGCDFDGTLELAVRLYQHDIFDWLHATKFPDLSGANPKYGSLALNAAKTNNIRMILSAIENDWDVSTPDMYGSTPLSLAAFFGYTDVVELLLTDPRVDINALSHDGCTPLLLAVLNGYTDTVRTLLGRADCDATREDHRGQGVFAFVESVEMAKLLRARHPTGHVRPMRMGLSGMHMVVFRGNRETFDYLAQFVTPEDAEELLTLAHVLDGHIGKERNWLYELRK